MAATSETKISVSLSVSFAFIFAQNETKSRFHAEIVMPAEIPARLDENRRSTLVKASRLPQTWLALNE